MRKTNHKIRFCPAMLRKLRKSAGFTKTALAEAAGLSRVTVSRLEHGHHVPTAASIFRLSEPLAEALRLKTGTVMTRLCRTNGGNRPPSN